VAAVVVEILVVLSSSRTAPLINSEASSIAIVGVAPPVEVIGEVTVMEVTPPAAAACHERPPRAKGSAVRTYPLVPTGRVYGTPAPEAVIMSPIAAY